MSDILLQAEEQVEKNETVDRMLDELYSLPPDLRRAFMVRFNTEMTNAGHAAVFEPALIEEVAVGDSR